MPSVATLAVIDLNSEKPALKHLRDQFCQSLVEAVEEDPLEDYFSDSDFSVYESNRGGDSPMEIKSIYNRSS